MKAKPDAGGRGGLGADGSCSLRGLGPCALCTRGMVVRVGRESSGADSDMRPVFIFLYVFLSHTHWLS